MEIGNQLYLCSFIKKWIDRWPISKSITVMKEQSRELY